MFSFFGFLMLGLISIINSGAVYATSTNLVRTQHIDTDVGKVGALREFDYTVWSEFNSIIETREDNGFLLVGRELADDMDAYAAPAMIKYTDSDNDGQYEVAWHKVLTGTRGEFFDAAPYYGISYGGDSSLIVVVGQINNKGIIHFYNYNGDLLDSYTSDTENVYKYVSKLGLNTHQFLVSDSQTTYMFADKDGTTSGTITKSGVWVESRGEDILEMTEPVQNDTAVITTGHIRYSAPGGSSINVDGNYIAATVRQGGIVVVTSDNKVQEYSIYGGGTMRDEIALPSPDKFKVVDVTTFWDGGFITYVRGISYSQCDLGGFANNTDVIYKIQDGTISLIKSLPISLPSSFDSDDARRSDILALPGDKVLVSSVNVKPAQFTRVYTEWYAVGENTDITYEMVSNDGPALNKCDANNNSSDTAVTSIEAGQSIVPRKPTATGFTFNGWYTDSGLTDKAPDSISPSTDTTLYARWNRNVYDVSFTWSNVYPSGATLPATQHIAHDSFATQPPNPGTYSGYTWNGWHLKNCGNPEYNFNTPVTSHLKIVGCWGQDQNTVSFRVMSTDNPASYSPSNAFRSQTMSYGSTFALPNPSPSGSNSSVYTFNGWYTDEELTQLYKAPGEGSDPVNSSFTLYGGWINHTVSIEEGEDGLELKNPDNLDSISFDKDTNTITLDGFDNNYPIEIKTDEEVTIVVKNDNVIGGGLGAAIESQGPLTITGDGTLTTITIATGDDLTIEDTNLTALMIVPQGDLNIKDSDVTALSMGSQSGDINIDNSNVGGFDESEIDVVLGTSGNINITNGSTVDAYAVSTENGDILVKDSTLNITSPDNPVTANNITVENGVFNLNSGMSSDDGQALHVNEAFTLDGGSVNLTNTNDANYYISAIVIKDGDFNAQAQTGEPEIIDNLITKVDGGSLNIEGLSGGGEGISCGLSTAFAIFNDGETNIELPSEYEGYPIPSIAVCVDLSGMTGYSKKEMMPEIIAGAKQMLDIDLVEGNYIQFNGGDTKLKAGLLSAAVLSFEDEELDAITVADGMVQDPDGTTIDKLAVEIDTDLFLHFVSFSNGGKMVLDEQAMTIINAATAVHIYPYVAPVVPPVPNTIDYQIIGLACGIFIAVMAQGMIIADLYRRLHGYEEEMATETAGNNTMIANEPVEQTQVQNEEQPAKIIEDVKPAEEIKVKFDNHNDTNDYSGPGDEYYY